MHSTNLHLKLLIALLIGLGAALTVYQIFILKIPVTESETDSLWSIDAKIDFVAAGNKPIKLQMFVPPLSDSHARLNESFISKNYGINITRTQDNRLATWSARRASGQQTLYYRTVLTTRYGAEPDNSEGPTYRDSREVSGPEKIAAEALLAPIRQHSADIETFISETIRRINSKNSDNARLLLGSNPGIERKVDAIDLVLSIAHVPLQQVHTLRLDNTQPQEPELWVRSYNGRKWLYFNPETAEQGLPSNRLVWWYGDEPMLQLEGGTRAQVSFVVNPSEINAMRLAQLTGSASPNTRFLDYSLYGLPLATQQTYQLILMIPIGVLTILVLRNLVGLDTLGTFTPVLIALAFRETQLGLGVLLFSLITALGLSLRSYLEHLKLQLLPRLSVVLTFVVILIAAISLFSHKLGLDRGLSISLFPMVILTMVIERLSVSWEERGGPTALKMAVGTLLAAVLVHQLMNIQALNYFVFTFPGVLLVMMGFMLAMGRYRGYRLSELFRFRALLKE